MVAYRQAILPGDQGSDIKAVKRAMIAMSANGAGTMIVNNRAGTSFVQVLNGILHRHGKKADSKYGPDAHAIIAPHFDLYGKLLYSKAKIRDRTPPPPPLGHETARQAAVRLLRHHTHGLYRADNPGDLRDLQRTAAGDPVWSAMGRWVYVDHRPIELVCWVIEELGHKVGTYAICGDHHYDGPHGHSGGLAVDISSLDNRGIGGSGMHDLTLSVARAIRSKTPPVLRPWQLISDGAGYVHYSDIAACCIPYSGFYDRTTLAGHRNHIHAGFYK